MGMPECKVDSRLQIDALLITDKTLTIIDFKDYGGTLMLPDEASFRRGPWETADGIVVKGGSSPNPFYQTGLQRERLVRILETFCRSLSSFNPRFVSTMVCFAKTMNVQGSIPGNVRSYFHIADENTFLECSAPLIMIWRSTPPSWASNARNHFKMSLLKALRRRPLKTRRLDLFLREILLFSS